jgi:small GTP-binding protein
MLAIMPKHKGTDKLHGELRRKIAKFTEEAERKAAISRASFYIKREGAGQVALVGLPNSGKSQLLAAVTDATPEVADYPFTTQTPNVGMMKFENIQIQIVDTPPITARGSRIWLNNILRNADMLAIVVDLADEPASQVEAILKELEGIGVVPPFVPIENAVGKRQKKMLLVGNKEDLDGAKDNWISLTSRYPNLPSVFVSAASGTNLGQFKKAVFDVLEIIRIYTKAPGRKPDLTEPVILKRGSTVKEAAEAIHKDFRAKMKYAVVWGSGKFDGQRVGQDHILQDGDIIEFHI